MRKTPNILIIQNKIPHYRKTFYNVLAKNYNITIIHSGRASTSQDNKYNEIIVPILRIGSFIFQRSVIKEALSSKYDAIIAMFDLWWIYNNILPLLVKGIPVIYWGHRYGKNLLANITRNFLMRRTDALILYGDEDIKMMVTNGIPKNKIFVAPNTIHVNKTANSNSISKNSFIYSGRAQKRKQVDELLIAFASAKDDFPPNTKIHIVGEGEENVYLKRLAEQLTISEEVVFHGEILNENALQELFEQAYAYISPGHVGLGVLHSFAYGIPVVTQRNKKHGQEFINLVHGENALIYDEPIELINILVNLTQKKTFTKELGNNAYKHYTQRRSLVQMVEGFSDAVDSVLKRNS
jgi:glycosyltransferase involved in cell wall biosynthesis